MNKKSKIAWIALACIMGLFIVVGSGVIIANTLSSLASLERTMHAGEGSTGEWDGYYRGHDGNDGEPGQQDGSAGSADRGGQRSYAEDLIVVRPGQIYTIEEIEELYGVQLQNEQDGRFYSGIYTVGKTGKMAPGIYHIDGDQEDMGHFCIFTPKQNAKGEPGYQIKAMVEYFGDYFAEFSEGELVVFTPDNKKLCMEPASEEPIETSSPLDSGCYRVGIDIPAGTYSLSIEAISQDELRYANSTPAAYVMQNLEFDGDSITESVTVEAGIPNVVTVKDGQYLELFGVRASQIS